MTLIEIDSKSEPIWRCEARTYFPPVTFRRVRFGDLGTPDRLEKTVHGEISYYLEMLLTDRVLLCWTDSRIEAGDVESVDTASCTLRKKSGEGVTTRVSQREFTNAEIQFVQNERLITAVSQSAEAQAAVSATAGVLTTTASEIRNHIYRLNKRYSAEYGEDMFKFTNESAKALSSLDSRATSKRDYGDLIDSLYFLIYEGSGACKRLCVPVPEFAMDIKFLRTALRHDVDHGNEKEIAAKMKRAGETFRKYAPRQTPEECGQEDFIALQSKLLLGCLEMLKKLN